MTEALKFLHVAAIAVWMAGLIGLPVLFVQRAHAERTETLLRLQAMVRFAYTVIVSPAAFIAVGTGIALIFDRQVFQPWFSVKLGIVGLLTLAHALMGLVVIGLFREGESYPAWRFVVVTLLTAGGAAAVLFLVLAKPPLPALPEAVDRAMQPGALRPMLAPFIPWVTP